MAAEIQPQNLTLEETVENLKLDPSSKLGDVNLVPSKDGSPSDVTSCISSYGDATGSVKESDMDHESLMAEQGMYNPPDSCYGYYYPGYDGYLGEFENQGYFLGSDGLNIQYPAIQADNGSLIYYMPGFEPGYFPYSPYLPGAMIGIDGQYLGQQPYFPRPMLPQSIASPGYFPTPLPYGSEVVPSYLWEPSHLVGSGAHGNGYAGVPMIPDSKSIFPAPTQTLARTAKSVPPSKWNNQLEMKGTRPSLDATSGPGMLNQLKPVNKAVTVIDKGCYPTTKFPSSNQVKADFVYPDNPVNNYKANGRGWGNAEKLKARSRANGISDFELLNEQNRGPRTNNTKGSLVSVVDLAGSLAVENKDNSNNSTTVVERDQFNLPDFPTKYDHALFFIIKSYSEDDIHKSIKYNVWASTPNGNKRLDGAYQDAQKKMGETGSKCPIFLFFSVNASGQFCGVAEMIGRVDFNKNMDFWQQDKWNGFFLVKWHIIKDVPNPQFRHIILENNDNKPVTNSRDTQEVRFPQGIEMLNIFKNYLSKTSILDDFDFYESRQKAMQDKRIRQSTPRLDHPQQEVDAVAQLTSSVQSIGLTATKKDVEELLISDKAKE